MRREAVKQEGADPAEDLSFLPQGIDCDGVWRQLFVRKGYRACLAGRDGTHGNLFHH